MSRLELEQHACELERTIKDNEVFLKQKELALTYARSNLEEHRSTWEYNRNNMKYMKKTDLVDIQEFKGVRKLLAGAREEFDDAAANVRRLLAEAAGHRNLISEATAKLARTKETLAAYGLVIPWRMS